MAATYVSTGTEVYFWPPKKFAQRRRFPLNITGVSYPGVTITSRETTHLNTVPPDDANEWGGRTFLPGVLGDPNELSLSHHVDPNFIPPKGVFIVQVVFSKLGGYKKAPSFVGAGFFTTAGGFNATDVDTNIASTSTIKLTGKFTTTKGTRT